MLLQVVFAAAAVGHAPGFSGERGRGHHHFTDTRTSQVEYRYGGDHTFTFACATHRRAFVEVVVPAADRTNPTIAFTIQGVAAAIPPPTTCAAHQYHEGFTMTSVVTKFKHDAACAAGDTFTLRVAHGSSFGVVVGHVEDLAAMSMWKMPYYYTKVGHWAGFACPGTFLLLWAALRLGRAAFGCELVGVHGVLVILWGLSLLADAHRFALADRVVGTCPVGLQAATGRAGLRWLYTVRLGLSVAGLVLAIGHHRKRWSVKWATVLTLLMLPIGHYLGVGLGLLVPLTAAYYAHDWYRLPPAEKHVSTARYFVVSHFRA